MLLFNTYFIGTLKPLLLLHGVHHAHTHALLYAEMYTIVVWMVCTIASSDFNTWANRGGQASTYTHNRHIIVFQRVEQSAERRFLTF